MSYVNQSFQNFQLHSPQAVLPLVNILLGNHLFCVNPCDLFVVCTNMYRNGSPLYFSLYRETQIFDWSNLVFKIISQDRHFQLSIFLYIIFFKIKWLSSSDLKYLSILISKGSICHQLSNQFFLITSHLFPFFTELLLEPSIE